MKRLEIHIAALLFILAFYSNANAQIIDTVSFSVNDLETETIGNYTVLSLPFFETTREIGDPELPCTTLYYLIPCDKQVVSITVLDSTMTTLPGTYLVYPKQLDIPVGEAQGSGFINPNPNVYNSNNPYPSQPLGIFEHSVINGYHLVGIHVCPLKYYPLNGKIEMLTSIRFQLAFENSTETIIRPLTQPRSMYETAKSHILSQIRNQGVFNQINGGPLSITNLNSKATRGINLLNMPLDTDPEFVIITNDTDVDGNSLFDSISGKNMTDVFQEFADWKTKKGVPTTVVTVDEICSNYSGSDTQEKIHNFLADTYQHYGMLYLILGGDINVIPARLIDTIIITHETSRVKFSPLYSDLYYTSITTSWDSNGNGVYGENIYDNNNDIIDVNPGFYYGRASVENVIEAETFVNKELAYEKQLSIQNVEYVNNIGAMVGYQETSQIQPNILTNSMRYIEGVFGSTIPIGRTGISQQNIIKWRSYDSDHLKPSVMDYWTELNKTNAINCFSSFIPLSILDQQHSHITIHIDHSSYSSMGTSSIKNNQHINRNDVDLFNNAPYYQIVYSMGCSPGSFEKDCIAEHFLNNPQGGAVAIIASTSTCYPFEVLELQFFLVYLYEHKISDHFYNPIEYRLGPLFYYRIKDLAMMCKNHLFGDPELPVWTREPVELGVTVSPAALSNQDNELTVSVSGMAYSEYATNDVMVCVMKDGEVYLREPYNGTAHSHDFVFTIDPETAGDLFVTVTGHNYIPYEDTIPVSITGKNVHVTDKSVMDFMGNDDGQLDAGETVNLSVTLENNGTLNLANVTAALSCEFVDDELNQNINDYLTVANSTANYGNMAVDASVTRFSYQLSLSNAIPDRTPLRCTLTVNDGSGHVCDKSFTFVIGAPDVEFVSVRHGTQQNGMFAVDVDLVNRGFGEAKGVAATLTSLNNPQLINETAIYGDMDHLESETGSFVFLPNGSMEGRSFSVTVTDAYNKSWTQTFVLNSVTDTVESLGFEGTEHSIRLRWSPVANSRGYYVYRSATAGGGYERLNSCPVPSSTYTDPALEAKRLYYYGVTYLDGYGNESPMAHVTAWTSLPVAPGWPVSIPDSLGRAWATAPNAADIDGDRRLEIFLATGDGPDQGAKGTLLGFDVDGVELYDIDHNPTTLSGFADIGMTMACTPAIGDIDNDGIAEIVVATRCENADHFLVAYRDADTDNDGAPDSLWSFQLDRSNFNGVVLADLDDDGTLEVVAANQGRTNGNTMVEVIDCHGQKLYSIPVPSWNNYDSKAVTMPVVADFDGRGHKEIAFGLEGGVYLWHSNGLVLDTLVRHGSCGRTDCPVKAADIDSDGILEIFYMSINDGVGYIRAVEPDGIPVTGWNDNSHSIPLSSDTQHWERPPYFCVADINDDGDIEVVAADSGVVKLWNGDGSAMSPGVIAIPGLDCWYLQPVVADIDGGGDCEIIVPSNDGFIHAYKTDGSPVPGWPLPVSNLATVPLVADLDNDGFNEVVAASQTELYVWHTEGEGGLVPWGRFCQNQYNNAVYVHPCSHDNDSVVISDEITWIDDRQENGVVVVEKDAVLTVRSKVRLGPGSHVIVKPGGKLVLDGGMLTNACHGQMWQGIQVWGNSNMHQSTVNGLCWQGTLELRNGAVVENAACAVDLCRPEVRYTSGGIVHADSAVFRNNAVAVRAHPYTNYNPNTGHQAGYSGSFRRCSFTVDGGYPGSDPFQHHVMLDGIDGIVFQGCDFSVDGSAPNVAPLNCGIAAYDAGFSVLAACTYGNGSQNMNLCPDECLVRSSFTGFHDAVHSVRTGKDTRAFSVRDVTFLDNNRGVYAHNTGYATILDSDFAIARNDSCSFGVYADNVTGFCIEENTFAPHGAGSGDTYGIAIFNGSGVNDIYLNEFDSLSCGNLAVGMNALRSPNPNNEIRYIGLTYTCNQNRGNAIDFCVLKDNGSGTIQTQQGSSTVPAGNTFDGGLYHFYNDGDFTVDYHHYRDAGQTPAALKLYRVNAVSTTNENDCETHYGPVVRTQEEKSALERDFISAGADCDDLERLYLDCVKEEGGETCRDLLAQLAVRRHDRSRAAGDIVRSDLMDTVADLNEIRQWLGNMGEISADRTAIASYVQEGDFDHALALAATLPALYGLSGDELTEHSNYTALLNLYKALHDTQRTIDQMNDNERLLVEAIAENGFGFSKSLARAIMERLGNDPYLTYTCPSLPTGSRGTDGPTEVREQKQTDFSVVMTPNPTSSWVGIDYSLPKGCPKATLDLFNTLGVKVMTVQLEGESGSKVAMLGEIPAGVYSYSVRCGDEVLDGKLVIVR